MAPTNGRRSAAVRRGALTVANHPDLVLLAGLLVVAAVVRAMLLFRAPVFLLHDSIAYFQVGYEFARGQAFDLPLRRTPLYPVFIGVVVWVLGEDLRSLALVQHLLGLMTVAATYLLAKAVFGRAAGLLAGLLVALSAPLLIYEHYLLAEPLFTALLTVGLLLVVEALKRERAWLYVLGGVALATAALARPVGQLLLPIVPLAILVHKGALRPTFTSAALVMVGSALVLLPWIGRSALVTGRVGSAGAVGQTLIDRISRHDQGFVLPSPESPSRHTDPTKIAVRRLILTQAARRARTSAIAHRIRSQFGLTEAEAQAAMQEVALEVIMSQPERYFWGTAAKFRRIVIGQDERLRVHWSSRKDGELRDDWLAERSIAHLYGPPSAVEEREYPVALALTRIFQPYQWRNPLAILIALGIGFGLVRGRRGPTTLLLLASIVLVLAGAALVGQVPRYRYPADPSLAVLAAGGMVGLVLLVGAAARRAAGVRYAVAFGRVSTAVPADRADHGRAVPTSSNQLGP